MPFVSQKDTTLVTMSPTDSVEKCLKAYYEHLQNHHTAVEFDQILSVIRHFASLLTFNERLLMSCDRLIDVIAFTLNPRSSAYLSRQSFYEQTKIFAVAATKSSKRLPQNQQELQHTVQERILAPLLGAIYWKSHCESYQLQWGKYVETIDNNATMCFRILLCNYLQQLPFVMIHDAVFVVCDRWYNLPSRNDESLVGKFVHVATALASLYQLCCDSRTCNCCLRKYTSSGCDKCRKSSIQTPERTSTDSRDNNFDNDPQCRHDAAVMPSLPVNVPVRVGSKWATKLIQNRVTVPVVKSVLANVRPKVLHEATNPLDVVMVNSSVDVPMEESEMEPKAIASLGEELDHFWGTTVKANMDYLRQRYLDEYQRHHQDLSLILLEKDLTASEVEDWSMTVLQSYLKPDRNVTIGDMLLNLGGLPFISDTIAKLRRREEETLAGQKDSMSKAFRQKDESINDFLNLLEEHKRQILSLQTEKSNVEEDNNKSVLLAGQFKQELDQQREDYLQATQKSEQDLLELQRKLQASEVLLRDRDHEIALLSHTNDSRSTTQNDTDMDYGADIMDAAQESALTQLTAEYKRQLELNKNFLEKKVDDITKDRDVLCTELAEAKGAVRKQLNEIARLKEDIAEESTRANENCRRIASNKKEIENLNTDRDNQRKQFDTRCTSFQQTLDSLEQQLQAAKDQAFAQSESQIKLESANERLANELATKEQRIASLAEDNASMKITVRDQNDEIQTINSFHRQRKWPGNKYSEQVKKRKLFPTNLDSPAPVSSTLVPDSQTGAPQLLPSSSVHASKEDDWVEEQTRTHSTESSMEASQVLPLVTLNTSKADDWGHDESTLREPHFSEAALKTHPQSPEKDKDNVPMADIDDDWHKTLPPATAKEPFQLLPFGGINVKTAESDQDHTKAGKFPHVKKKNATFSPYTAGKVSIKKLSGEKGKKSTIKPTYPLQVKSVKSQNRDDLKTKSMDVEDIGKQSLLEDLEDREKLDEFMDFPDESNVLPDALSSKATLDLHRERQQNVVSHINDESHNKYVQSLQSIVNEHEPNSSNIENADGN